MITDELSNYYADFLDGRWIHWENTPTTGQHSASWDIVQSGGSTATKMLMRLMQGWGTAARVEECKFGEFVCGSSTR